MIPDTNVVLRNVLTEHERLTMSDVHSYSETHNSMHVAEHFYNYLLWDNNWKPLKDTNNWMVALTAEIASMGKGNNTKGKKWQEKEEWNPNRGKGKKDNSVETDSWKSTAPKEREPHTKTDGKRMFTLCPHHKYCGGHSASDCFKVNKKPSNTPTTRSASWKHQSFNWKLQNPAWRKL